MKISFFNTICLLLICVGTISGQFLNLEWVNASDIGYRWALDNENNIIQATSFSDSLTLNTTLYVSDGGEDILLQKLDAEGNKIWATSISTSGDELITAMDVNAKNEICLMGRFQGQIDLNLRNDGLPYPVLSQNDDPRFIAVYNEDLSIKYAVVLETNGDSIYQDAVLLTDDSEVIVSGDYENELVLNIINQSPILVTNPGKHTYAMKLEANGSFAWWNVDQLTNGDFVLARHLSYNYNNLVTSFASFQNAAVARLDFETGTIIWENQLGARPRQQQSDSSGNIYVTGNFDELLQTDWDPGAGELFLESDSFDTFLMKYDQDGNLVWAKNIITGNLIDTGTALTIGKNDEVYITGCIQSSADFDPSEEVYELNASGAEDVFIAAYNQDGDLMWAEHFGGNSYDIGFQIKAIEDSLWVYGIFNREVDFDLSEEEVILESQNNGDNASYFILKHHNCATEECISATLEEEISNLAIYPNPFSSELNFSNDQNLSSIKIHSFEGNLVFSSDQIAFNTPHDFSFLNPGIYLISVYTQDGYREVRKIIKS